MSCLIEVVCLFIHPFVHPFVQCPFALRVITDAHRSETYSTTAGPFMQCKSPQERAGGKELSPCPPGLLLLVEDQLGDLADCDCLSLISQRKSAQLRIVLKSFDTDLASTAGDL
jgi:hypothetical protein